MSEKALSKFDTNTTSRGALRTFATLRFVAALLTLLVVGTFAMADELIDEKARDTTSDSQAAIEFFETRIRPVLIERCYECHNTADNAEADLAIDWRDGIRAETERGRVVVPGKPDESLLLKVIRHQLPDVEMPEGGPALADDVIDDFQRWIETGAVDPRTSPPNGQELTTATSWPAKLEKRKQWWSFQPVQNVWPPAGDTDEHPIDQFVRVELAKHKLPHAAPADRRTLIRRLSFALTGLPPSPADVENFVNDSTALAFENVVDTYLASPRFGERWARHWMDLVRYSDSHGSEGDPAIPYAYQYRDYLIRALNSDVPYDQLVREHLAGDLLTEPRVNVELGINESAIGPAHFRFVFHGFAPTDALEEKVRFTDDQVNVVSKAFMGLTVSCARCHDHKFDAISQADYYAMFGVFASCRPALRDVNLLARQAKNVNELRALKKTLRKQLADDWLADVQPNAKASDVSEPGDSNVSSRLLNPDEALKTELDKENQDEALIGFWQRLVTKRDNNTSLETVWNDVRAEWKTQRRDEGQSHDVLRWNLADEKDYDDWYADGNGMPDVPGAAGQFAINETGKVVQGMFPSGLMTHSISARHRGLLNSKRFDLADEYNAWLLIAGRGQSSVRYVVQNYPRDGTVYPIPTIDHDEFRWQKLELGYWKGDNVHFELATSKDAPIKNSNNDQSWFAVRNVVVRKSDAPAPTSVDLEFLTPLFKTSDEAPLDETELANRISATLRDVVQRWREDDLSDADALWLNACLWLLPNDVDSLTSAKSNVERFRQLQAQIPDAVRVPGIVEADAFDQPLYVRGDHRKPADPVPRRFLEAIDAETFSTNNSGRRELAESILHPDNPLTGRVITNRIWHYLFGRGLVATPDNFGQLGDVPSHPQLLDYLATRMSKNNWSIKDAIRFTVTSKTWQADSTPTTVALEIDPENRLLSHANVNRLDAESIRDSLLAVTGQLETSMYGDGFAANKSAKRRSVYVQSKRNSLDAFLQTFDSPTPFSTTGRRDVTNVPSQSLTMLNDPFVMQLADAWAKNVEGDTNAKIAKMFTAALGRPATSDEQEALKRYWKTLRDEKNPAHVATDDVAWARLAHAILNLKEFIYVK